MTPATHRHLAFALLFIVPAFWGVNYLVARSAASTVAPHALACARWFFAGLFLATLTWREIAANPAAINREWKNFLLLGALGMWICGAFVYLGARTTTATNIGLFYAISPVLITVFSALVLKERIGPVQVTGTALALAGFMHVLLKGHWLGLSGLKLVTGDLWVLVSTVSWAAYTILLRAWPSAFRPMARLTLICAGGVVILLPFAAIEAAWFMPSHLSWTVAGYVLLVALFPGFGAYLAYSFMLNELGAARVGVVLYLGPIYAAAMAWVGLGEPVLGFHWIGAALILPGIYLATRPSRAPA
ncbi:MAG: DMT family transporter [Opitutus sp.]|nr:DMT family transporter [Opitutus sp.]